MPNQAHKHNYNMRNQTQNMPHKAHNIICQITLQKLSWATATRPTGKEIHLSLPLQSRTKASTHLQQTWSQNAEAEGSTR